MSRLALVVPVVVWFVACIAPAPANQEDQVVVPGEGSLAPQEDCDELRDVYLATWLRHEHSATRNWIMDTSARYSDAMNSGSVEELESALEMTDETISDLTESLGLYATAQRAYFDGCMAEALFVSSAAGDSLTAEGQAFLDSLTAR